MVTTRVTPYIEDDMVIVEYDGDVLHELTPEEAIECDGKIAEIGRKLLEKRGSSSSTERESDHEDDSSSKQQESDQKDGFASDEQEPGHEENQTAVDLTTASELSRNEIYVGVVDRMSKSGNAIIELPDGMGRSHVNLGPVDDSVEGEEVRFNYTGGVWAECLTEKYLYESYSPHDGRSKTPSRSSSRSSSNPFSTKGISPTDPGNKNKLLNGLR